MTDRCPCLITKLLALGEAERLTYPCTAQITFGFPPGGAAVRSRQRPPGTLSA